MHTDLYLERCLKYGISMPKAMHLIYFNCTSKDEIIPYGWFWEVNINVFSPHLKKIKKARRGHYCGIRLNVESVHFIVGLIESYNEGKRSLSK